MNICTLPACGYAISLCSLVLTDLWKSATSRLRFLFVAAKIWRHAGRTGVHYSDHYEEKGVFERLMNRLRNIMPGARGYGPVMTPALR